MITLFALYELTPKLGTTLTKISLKVIASFSYCVITAVFQTKR